MPRGSQCRPHAPAMLPTPDRPFQARGRATHSGTLLAAPNPNGKSRIAHSEPGSSFLLSRLGQCFATASQQLPCSCASPWTQRTEVPTLSFHLHSLLLGAPRGSGSV